MALLILNMNINFLVDKKCTYIYNHLFLPVPRINEGLCFSTYNIATSMIDTSDSLAQSLYKLYQQSNVGFKIYEDLIPKKKEIVNLIDIIQKNNKSKYLDYIHHMLYSGGDFELLFTVSKNKINLIKEIENKINRCFKDLTKNKYYNFVKHKYPLNISIIGKVVNKKDKIKLINKDGKEIEIKNIGHDSI